MTQAYYPINYYHKALSILDVAAVLDPPLVSFYSSFRPLNKYLNWCQCQYYDAIYAIWGK